jgi:hypothetical protein
MKRNKGFAGIYSLFIKTAVVLLVMTVFASAGYCGGEAPFIISDIRAFHWQGQTFLQWEEEDTGIWTEFNVYRSEQTIKNVDAPGVECIARRIIPRSGRNFYILKRTGFKRPYPCNEKRNTVAGSRNLKMEMRGMLLPGGLGESSITGGLFVTTPGKKGRRYYAVTFTPGVKAEREGFFYPGKKEDKRLFPGKNVLVSPVIETDEAPCPYLISGNGTVPASTSEKKYPLNVYLYWINLTHSGFGDDTENHRTYLFWMPGEFGWREGLPTIFSILTPPPYRFHTGSVKDPYADSNRSLVLVPDDSNFAFMGFSNTWWFGYNSEILNPEKMADGTVKLYSQKKLSFIINWILKEYPVIDRNRVSASGYSMGGTGALFSGLRHPEIFASITAYVPAGNVVKLKKAEPGLTDLYGPMDADIKTENGTSIWDELSNVWYLKNTEKDLPFIQVYNGREDEWMDWQCSVEMYRALEKSRHPFISWWATSSHNFIDHYIPTVVLGGILENNLRKNCSVPAITKCSLNEDYGDGRTENGHPCGGQNYMMRWEVEQDTPSEYGITISTSIYTFRKADIEFTPRNLQQFRIKPGEEIFYKIYNRTSSQAFEKGSVQADSAGLVNIKVSNIDRKGKTVILKKMPFH